MKTLGEIRAMVERLAATVNADPDFLPTYGQTQDFAQPHIEVDLHGYHYVVVERGRELERETTVNLDDLLYRIFQGVTFNLACNHELANRIEHQDSRRILFRWQVELLSKLSRDWANRRTSEQQAILKEHPFRDEE